MSSTTSQAVGLFAAEPDTVGQWRLAEVQLVNWGTFHGSYRLPIAREGHLFTGPSGSGKSSLLDAIAAVLTPDKWLRFNIAAQEAGARGSDRSLMSYVRGAWSREADQYADKVVSTYLRPRATWSGIGLRYEDGRGHTVSLLRMFHARGASTDRDAVKDVHLLVREPMDLLDLQPYVENGIDARRIKAAWPDATVATSNQGQFYARMRRQFGLKSESALHLLHKTQSAKNLGTLDQLFRQFMLDRPGTFDRADNAVEQFGELSEAHGHVVDLRRQSVHLRAMSEIATAYTGAVSAKEEADRVIGLLDSYQNRTMLRIATDDASALRGKVARAEEASRRAGREHQAAKEVAEQALRRQYEAGGGAADDLLKRIKETGEQADATERRHRALADELQAIGFTAPSSASDLERLQEAAARELEAPMPDAVDHATLARLSQARTKVEALEKELVVLRRHRSNIPGELQAVRDLLARDLGLPRGALPFAGELLDVDSGQTAWSGAIERVLRPLALSLLVRDEYVRAVRRRLDDRHLGLRLVVEAVPLVSSPPRPVATDVSLVHRVQITDGPFREWLSGHLADRYDYACVESPDDLDAVSRGVTRSGQIKTSERRYVKDDRFAVDDRGQWVLGSDTQPKIDLLETQLKEARDALASVVAEVDESQRLRDEATRTKGVLERLAKQRWDEIDAASVRRKVADLGRQLSLLTADRGELAEAVAAYQAARVAEDEAEKVARKADVEESGLRATLTEVATQVEELTRALPALAEVGEADLTALDERYRTVSGQRRQTRKSLPETTLKVTKALHLERDRATDIERSTAERYTALATEFRTSWAVAGADLTASVEDRAGYQRLLDDIVARGLPEHESSFLRLLREKSREVVGFLLSDIREAPRQVEQRIDPVNSSLAQSMFDRDRYLFIKVRQRWTDEVRAFLDDLRSVVEGQWDDEDLASAEKRFATLAGIMRRLGSSDPVDRGWRNRCLDTREHVTFLAQELDPAGVVVNVHESSAGLSGGQRQKLVIFCLAAALRYQLAEDEDAVPTYGTVVLDEAFDKADAPYTRMAMDVFRLFGFHMILATPQKLLQTIEPYVGAVTAVANPDRNRSMLSNAPIKDA